MNFQDNNFNVSNIIPGTVITLEPKGALIDIGIETLVYIELEEISLSEIESPEEVLQIGETREFLIIHDFDQEGNEMLSLSIRQLEKNRVWERIRQLHEEDATVYVKVEGTYEEGLLVKIEGEIGTIPELYLNSQPREELIGQMLPVKIVTSNNYSEIILSARWADKNITKKLYPPGEIIIGTVIKIEEKGGWIDIGEPKPLYVPIYQLSMNKIEKVEEVLQLNQVREFVIDFYYNNGYCTLSLSIRLLEEKIAWERIQQIHAENATVYATVVRINRNRVGVVYIEGLQSYIANLNICLRQPIQAQDFVGQALPVKFTEINQYKYGYRLILRRVLNDEDVLKEGDLASGRISALRKYGAFVDLGHFSVLLHISEISHAQIENVAEVFKENDQIKALVIATNIEKGRVAVSTKVLEPAPGDMLKNPQFVYDNAEKMAEKYRQEMENIRDLE